MVVTFTVLPSTLSFFEMAVIGKNDPDAAFSQIKCCAFADAATSACDNCDFHDVLLSCVAELDHSFHFGTFASKARVPETTRAEKFGSRTRAEPSIGWPPSS